MIIKGCYKKNKKHIMTKCSHGNCFLLLISICLSCNTFKNLMAKDYSVSTSRHTYMQVKAGYFINGVTTQGYYPDTIIESNTPEKKTSFWSFFKKRERQKKEKVANPNTSHKSSEKTNNNNQPNESLLQSKYGIIMGEPIMSKEEMSILQVVDNWWRTPYCLGGDTKKCIDCSAFTQHIYSEVYHIQLPRTAEEQYKIAHIRPRNEYKTGDLIFFSAVPNGTITHVGVYIGNHKFAQASTSSGVTITDINDPYWKKKFRGVGYISS